MPYVIDYSDTNGAGDVDPREYLTWEDAIDEARERLASGDMSWAMTAKIFPIDDDGEPLQDRFGATWLTA